MSIQAKNNATSKEYRGRHEIIAQILQDVNNSGSEGITKTMIIQVISFLFSIKRISPNSRRKRTYRKVSSAILWQAALVMKNSYTK